MHTTQVAGGYLTGPISYARHTPTVRVSYRVLILTVKCKKIQSTNILQGSRSVSCGQYFPCKYLTPGRYSLLLYFAWFQGGSCELFVLKEISHFSLALSILFSLLTGRKWPAISWSLARPFWVTYRTAHLWVWHVVVVSYLRTPMLSPSLENCVFLTTRGYSTNSRRSRWEVDVHMIITWLWYVITWLWCVIMWL